MLPRRSALLALVVASFASFAPARAQQDEDPLPQDAEPNPLESVTEDEPPRRSHPSDDDDDLDAVPARDRMPERDGAGLPGRTRRDDPDDRTEHEDDAGSATKGSPRHGLLGPVRLGPTVQVGFPHPVNFGLDLLYEGLFSFGFATGEMALGAAEPLEARVSNWDLRARWHPLRDAFFVGLAYGKQQLAGEAKENLRVAAGNLTVTVPTTVQITARTTYVTPHAGWLRMWDDGFTLGFELGAQIPLAGHVQYDAAFRDVTPSQEAAVKASPEYRKFEKRARDAGDKLAKKVLPYVTLVRVGWLL